MHHPNKKNYLSNLLKNARVHRRKLLFLLIDPDKFSEHWLEQIISHIDLNYVDAFLVGGSFLRVQSTDSTVLSIKKYTRTPVCIFPGNYFQISPHADAILLLSLISGRNPEYLIGQHVVAAPILEQSELEIIPTGYILINTGTSTSVHYISQTLPIPSDKKDIAAYTALAGEFLGLQCIYLESGSGSQQPIDPMLVEYVSKKISIPLIVGGGIRNTETAIDLYNSGAQAIVIGSLIEQNPHEFNNILKYIK